MAELDVNSSTNKSVKSGRDSTHIRNHGTPDKIVGRLLDTVEDNNHFYQKKIEKKEAHIEQQSKSLLEKNEIIKALIKELSIVSKQNEEARDILIDEFRSMSEYLKSKLG